METAEYLREQVRILRELARAETDPALKRELEELAARCEALANHMQGNGKLPK
ncbi:MAG TPA: hypothetical protein VG757_05665 [Devosia sp.]|nr:hypothetical protein [Devosia sp.]